MRPLISASKRILAKVRSAVNKAMQMGDDKALTKGRVILMVLDGQQYEYIGRIFQISVDTVGRYVADFVYRGSKSLRCKSKPGRPPKLSKQQRQELKQLIKKGPAHNGYPGSTWQGPMIQDLIMEVFGVCYAAGYIARIMHKLGFSWQKGKFDLSGKDARARAAWWNKVWPEIKAIADETKAKILFEDECSFSLSGTLGYGWGIKGEQPVVKTHGTRKNLKLFGCIEFGSGRLFGMQTESALNSETYIAFIKMVLSQTRSKLIWIHDGAGYHTSQDVRALFHEKKSRISVYQLPAYSPDFNPIEGLWKKIKRYGTHMTYFATFEDLCSKVAVMMQYFQDRSEEVLSLMSKYQEAC